MVAKRRLTLRKRSAKRRTVRRSRTVSRKYNNKMIGGIALNSYTILGSGGYGMILESPDHSTIVKVFYNKRACTELSHEYEVLSAAYNAINNKLCGAKHIYVPRPLKMYNTPITYKGEEYLCGIEMEKIQSLAGFNGLIHLALAYPDMGQYMGKNMGEPVSDTNPSRGYFAGAAALERIIGADKLHEMVKCMGYSMAALMLSGILPNDVEYTLGLYNGELSLIVLDFGLANMMKTTTNYKNIDAYIMRSSKGLIDPKMDIYFPSDDDIYYGDVISGVRLALECIVDADPFFVEIVQKYFEI